MLFTSGTEGEPKGVVLSHANLLSNVEQVRAHLALYQTDILFNPLPTFHCFGLTVGSLMPLFLGIKVVCHPTPLQPREIVRRIKDSGATILLSTDTFISQYARAGDQGDLNSLRLTVCGAERLRDETRALCARKYSIELLEGYGVTEASQVVAANQPEANRPGTVGKMMKGMETRLEPVEGIPNAGRLFVKGPNIMLGYMKPEQPALSSRPKDGWHDTGDRRLDRRPKALLPSGAGSNASPRSAAKRSRSPWWKASPRRYGPTTATRLSPCPMDARANRSCLSPRMRKRTGTIWWAGPTITGFPNWRCRAALWAVAEVPVLGTGKTRLRSGAENGGC